MSKTPHTCPVCSGRGTVPRGFYDHGWGRGSSTGIIYTNGTGGEVCKTCGGTGIVWHSEPAPAPSNPYTPISPLQPIGPSTPSLPFEPLTEEEYKEWLKQLMEQDTAPADTPEEEEKEEPEKKMERPDAPWKFSVE